MRVLGFMRLDRNRDVVGWEANVFWKLFELEDPLALEQDDRNYYLQFNLSYTRNKISMDIVYLIFLKKRMTEWSFCLELDSSLLIMSTQNDV